MGCFVDSEKWSMSTCVDFIWCSVPLVNVNSNTSTRKNTANGKSQSRFEKRFLLGTRDATSTWERDGGCGHIVLVLLSIESKREEWGVGRYHDASSFSPLPSLSFPQIPLAFST
ncbi:hypothetical protein L2E82_27728 [Cichorium intybus]|uniref:Uncharacterized protein n=1 Tax=Cichorium intybus TaxID=13427 RepID=A0ACB9CTW1_CICIN|nr:hypothetical protein L2E82_27728 [Cichorium intybus]